MDVSKWAYIISSRKNPNLSMLFIKADDFRSPLSTPSPNRRISPANSLKESIHTLPDITPFGILCCWSLDLKLECMLSYQFVIYESCQNRARFFVGWYINRYIDNRINIQTPTNRNEYKSNHVPLQRSHNSWL